VLEAYLVVVAVTAVEEIAPVKVIGKVVRE